MLVNDYDEHIHNKIEFSHHTSPFIVWSHNSYKDTTTKLLEGKEITIKADIRESSKKNAIRFNEIGIHFKLANETKQNEFDEQLQYFQVSMTHQGNSFYRCGTKFYVITSDNLTINYSFNNNKHGEPSNTNAVYDKIKNNDYVLSPYTTWSIKLNHVNDSFKTLSEYANQVIDLALEGRGQYIDQDIDVCNDDLNNYYELDDDNMPNLPDIIDATISHQRRKRRGIENDSFVTSGASRNINSSFINKFFNSIKKYLNPKSVYQEELEDITFKITSNIKCIRR